MSKRIAVTSRTEHIKCDVSSQIMVESERVEQRDGYKYATVDYMPTTCQIDKESGCMRIRSEKRPVTIRTKLVVPKVGVMIVGLGGNNGSTLAAGLLANKRKLSWETVKGMKKANWMGSVAMSGTVKVGQDSATGSDMYIPIRQLLPMLHPDDIVLGGWDISGLPISEAMKRAAVVPLELQRLIAKELDETIQVLPGIYEPTFIATNQKVRADNIVQAKNKKEEVELIRKDICDFKKKYQLEKVIILWSGNTERFSEHSVGIHDTADNLLKALENNEREIAPSLQYALAALLEGCSYINGSPQNTFCPGLIELATQKNVYLAGDDLKTGQTKLKSVLTDFLVSTAIKPTAIVSYNHLGNNDGLNLSSAQQFRSKEITKSSVVDDMIASNSILYPASEDHPDHLIVIKYIPSVGDSKRALDEYSAEIFMGGTQTFVIHNTCEDSLLAVPIILDLILFEELLDRITLKLQGDSDFHRLHTMASLLSLFLKAPAVPSHSPVINALFPQKEGLVNFIRAAAGLPPTDYICLDHRV